MLKSRSVQHSSFGDFCATVLVLALFVGACAVSLVQSQTSTTAVVTGTVTDSSSAAVVGARVVLLDTATNTPREEKTNNQGQYVFVNAVPGVYKLTAGAVGFETIEVQQLKLDVGRSYSQNFQLKVGAQKTEVQVVAGTVELQTLDSSVGNVLKGSSVLNLPSANRSIVQYADLQPATAALKPGAALDYGGGAGGSRLDQNTWIVDGIDVTEGTSGGAANGVYINGPNVPVPVDSVEEFRAVVATPNATIGASSGGAQFTAVRRRGGNAFHGAAYWYHQNDNLNATGWDLNRLGEKKPELKDNRFGARLGGPLIKDKTFFFFHFEGRRFPNSTTINRIVPTDTLRQGILQFRDASGNIRGYNLATSTLCGASNSDRCDPLGIGISPVVKSFLALYPQGNDGTSGDGLNTTGFTKSADSSTNSNYYLMRLDHNISKQWRFDGSATYSWVRVNDPAQVDIGGLTGGKLGDVRVTRLVPDYNLLLIGGLNGQITPTLVNDFRFGYYRDTVESRSRDPFPQVSGTNVALALAMVDAPMNFSTFAGATNRIPERAIQFTDNLSWIKGSHMLQFGASFRNQMQEPLQNGVGSAYVTPFASVGEGDFLALADSNRPPVCGAVSVNCIQAGDVSRWDALYGAVLGLVNDSQYAITRDGSLKALPAGTPITARAARWDMEFHGVDTWRVSHSFTLTYGLQYRIETAPSWANRRASMMIDNSTGKPINPLDYLAQKDKAARSGEVYNPELAYQTLSNLKRDSQFNTDYSDWAPRVSVAWQPYGKTGLLGKLFGEGRTVIRAGWSIVYDRLNLNSAILSPQSSSSAFNSTVACNGPTTTGTCAGAPNDPSTAFRVGVNGNVPLGTAPTVTAPVVPELIFNDTGPRQYMADIRSGRSHTISLSLQRELPADMILEVGYAGRYSSRLPFTVNLNSVPFFMKDPASGQTLAQAVDAVAGQLRSGVAATAVTPQPWFENQVPGCGTQCLAASSGRNFIAGNLYSLTLLGIDISRFLAGQSTISNMQLLQPEFITDWGHANYNALLVTVRKRMTHGLTFDFNYTFSRALDNGVNVDQGAFVPARSSFLRDLNYGPSAFDSTHTANFNWYYELPFKGGHLNKLIEGWAISGIWRAYSALPLDVNQTVEAFGGMLGAFGAADGIVSSTLGAIPSGTVSMDRGVHSGVTGSGNVATTGDPATGGTGLNLFSNPEAVFNAFRPVLLSSDTRLGRGKIRGLSHWNFDFSVGKTTRIGERLRLKYSADFFNLFNKVQFNNPALSLLNPATFGVLTSQYNEPRHIQMGLRVEF